ncbi:hypothetical protein [Streptomyces phaeochromogenes]|uniref:hypothetical protein n=1 Tax=Streptomyces phaeochromogenes TaxID=1923 RepID=UPI002DDBF8E4|nr:hypothetical protein [Streptomyces phaeochromogenes]WRZ35879.1 hypothetical protein OG931_53295 [Streptomyces phaeochromogenes]
MNEVLSQLDEVLFSSVEGVLIKSVKVTDTVVRVEARTTAGRAACPALLVTARARRLTRSVTCG